MTKVGKDVLSKKRVTWYMEGGLGERKEVTWYSLLKTHALVDKAHTTLLNYNWIPTENWEKGHDFFFELWKFYLRQKDTYRLPPGKLDSGEIISKFSLPKIYVNKKVYSIGKKIMKLAEKDIDFAIKLLGENLTPGEMDKVVEASLKIWA